MKRHQLIRHLEQHGCVLVREGAKHSLYVHAPSGLRTAIPRHREIAELMVKAICEQVELPTPNR